MPPSGASADVPPPVPDNEERRLAALHECVVAESGADTSFDNIARLTARLCGTPVAMINLIEKHRIWTRYGFGLETPAFMPRHESICAHAILSDDVLVIPDTATDPRTPDRQHAAGGHDVRFYAGAPLILDSGERLGTLSVVDIAPREPSEQMLEDLQALAAQVTALLDLRRKGHLLRATRDELRQILDAVPSYIYFKDADNGIVNLNRAAAEAMQLRVQDVAGHQTEEFFPASDAADFLRDDRMVIGSGIPKLGIEEYHEGGEGERRLIRSDKFPLKTLSGESRILAIATDITELRESQRQLVRSQQLLSSIMNSGPSVIYAKDGEGRLLMVNERFAEAVGREPQSLIGLSDYDLFPADVADFMLKNDERVRESGELVEADEDAIIDGERRHFLSSKFPLIDTDGNIYGTAGISTDVTQMHQLRDELEAKNDELERFVYTASHDLKSPIVTINGYLSHLKNDLANNKVDDLPEYARCIERAASRMQTNIDELLELSRIGRVAYEPQEVAIKPVLDAILDEHRMAIEERGIVIRTELEQPALRCDPQHLDQIMWNLISNAIKYGTSSNEPEIVVKTASGSDGGAELAIHDNGVGVSEEHAELIFGLFQKLSNDKQSSGIGLSIVRQVIRLYGGRVRVERSASGGACFRVIFPAGSQRTP